MKKFALLAGLALVSLPAMAEKLACEDLKSQIDAKLQAKGVKSYTLEIVSADSLNAAAAPAAAAAAPAQGASGAAPAPAAPAAMAKASDVKVVGSCDGGAKRITYKRG